MYVRPLAAAAAAAALLGGAAYAQQPEDGRTPNQPEPASPTEAQTGVPSVDSTRPTGQDAGRTNLPEGQVSGTVSGQAATPPAGDTSATAATSVGAEASMTAQLVTNGPIPDTPENRRKYGQPLSRAGKMTAARGN